MNFVETFKYCVLQKYDHFNGRAGRREFWQFTIICGAINLLFFLLVEQAALPEGLNLFFSLFFSALLIILNIPSVAVLVRRLHDVNRRAINCFWVYLPLVGHLYLLYLCLKPGDVCSNKFGSARPDPLLPDSVLLDWSRVKKGIQEYWEIFETGITQRAFDYTGRASREEYWKFNATYFMLGCCFCYIYAFLCMVGLVLSSILQMLGVGNVILSYGIFDLFMVGYPIVAALIMFIFLLGHISVAVRRLHDQNLSGAYLLMALVPLVNILFIWFMTRVGTLGDNDYGKDPLNYGEARPAI